MKLKKLVAVNILILTALLTGCSSSDTKSAAKNDSKSEAEVQKEAEDKKQEETVQEKADIEALAAECMYNVYWYTQDDAYSAGTAFVMDSDVYGEKLLVTAFHFLWPDDADTFSGSELPEFVLGGEIYNGSTYEFTNATLKNCVVI